MLVHVDAAWKKPPKRRRHEGGLPGVVPRLERRAGPEEVLEDLQDRDGVDADGDLLVAPLRHGAVRTFFCGKRLKFLLHLRRGHEERKVAAQRDLMRIGPWRSDTLTLVTLGSVTLTPESSCESDHGRNRMSSPGPPRVPPVNDQWSRFSRFYEAPATKIMKKKREFPLKIH